MEKKYKICPMCGGKFRACMTCEAQNAASWKKVADSFEHYAMYVTLVLYKRDEITKDEASERLSNCSFSGLLEGKMQIIDEIFS